MPMCTITSPETEGALIPNPAAPVATTNDNHIVFNRFMVSSFSAKNLNDYPVETMGDLTDFPLGLPPSPSQHRRLQSVGGAAAAYLNAPSLFPRRTISWQYAYRASYTIRSAALTSWSSLKPR